MRSAISRRMFSTAENHRMNVLKSAMKFEQIAVATNEAELAKAVAFTAPAVEATNLPENLKYFDAYVNSSAGAAQVPYVPDPNAWQNLPFHQFVIREYSRPHNFWIFIVGPL
jgi:hypothetical protein